MWQQNSLFQRLFNNKTNSPGVTSHKCQNMGGKFKQFITLPILF
mgnify:CR=1 FL=1